MLVRPYKERLCRTAEPTLADLRLVRLVVFFQRLTGGILQSCTERLRSLNPRLRISNPIEWNPSTRSELPLRLARGRPFGQDDEPA
jgi:hypothetical protein